MNRALRIACTLICVALIGLMAHAGDPGIILGYPEFQNQVYTETPTTGTADPRLVPGANYGALSFFSGHVSPSGASGAETIVQSGIGQPFQTRTLVEPDFLLGQEMRPKSGKSPAADLQTVTWDPPLKMFYLSHVKKFFAAEPGFVTVDWGGAAGKEELFISFEAVHTPMAIYHTDQYPSGSSGLNGSVTGAPSIDLNVPDLQVTIHYNTLIPQDEPGPDGNLGGFDDVRYLWKSSAPKEMRAARRSGLVVIHYDNSLSPGPNNFLGVQVVDVRSYTADNGSGDAAVNIGDRLSSTRIVDSAYTADLPPVVARGRTAPQGDTRGAYVYQHELTGASQNGAVFAVRETTAPTNIEVFWMRRADRDSDGDFIPDTTDSVGLVWPYEMGRYTTTWPTASPGNYQVYVRGKSTEPTSGPGVTIPATLNAVVMPFKAPLGLQITNTPSPDGTFQVGPVAGRDNWALLKYAPGNPAGFDDVSFQVVRCVAHDASEPGFSLTPSTKIIGAEITDTYHKGSGPGYIHVAQLLTTSIREDRYDWAVYNGHNGSALTNPITATGQIIPVNTGNLEVWWYNKDSHGIDWPSKVARYSAAWPPSPEQTVISRQAGVPLPDPTSTAIYYQNVPGLRGFNPNDEHSFTGKDASGPRVYTLRDDLGLSHGAGTISADKSEPYTLLRYKKDGKWLYKIYKVLAEDSAHPFSDWSSTAGDPYEVHITGFQDGKLGPQGPINAPIPIQQFLPNWTEENTIVGYPCDRGGAGCPPVIQARDKRFYPLGAGVDGVSTEDIVAHFYYPLDAKYGFYFPSDYASRAGVQSNPVAGSKVPWLNLKNGNGNTPIDVKLSIYWPEDPGELEVGDTLFSARNGLPAVDGECSTEVLYQQTLEDGSVGRESVVLIDPFQERTVLLPVADFPFGEIRTEQVGSDYVLSDLSPGLSGRIRYDSAAGLLRLKGQLITPVIGDPYLELNVLTEQNLDELLNLGPQGAAVQSAKYKAAVMALYSKASEVVRIDDPANTPDTGVAITAGHAQAPGFVTVIFGNNPDCIPEGAPAVYTFRVTDTPWKGRVVPIEPDCVFQEKLTMQHVGDFGGKADEYEFQWLTSPPLDGGMPPLPTVAADGSVSDLGTWTEINPSTLKTLDDEVPERVGANAITITKGRLILTDNWYTCHYRYRGDNDVAWRGVWSDLTDPALGEGWNKRVMGGVGPFAPRDNGLPAGLTNAELAFASYGDKINSIVNQISQAGERWEGDTPLNCASVDDNGLIAIYETVLNRGISLSLNANPPYADEDINQALLLVASRVSDLYSLLGNEAYADASDPTIGFGTSGGEFGRAEASSIFCFQGQNQVAGLIDEELALLRGVHNDNGQRNTRLRPAYNRLIWNFNNDITGGEVAYALNYGIRDNTGNVETRPDGTIDEADAKHLYPQGHGDAWGHYLTAMTPYYRLLRNEHYEWKSRSEFINVGGAALQVDYRDEQKFAADAAAKARTGAEIVNLTYRKNYLEDPAKQYQGYRDTDPQRAWGVADWGSRAGQGAYFDWVAANAVLPAKSAKQGLEKIDRTTIPELREITARFEEIQSQVDNADRGLNPLGVARNAVPFDIKPGTDINNFVPHFEQIYTRAVSAMNTAISAFNFAEESTQNLRRQAEQETQFKNTIEDQESDFRGRLIEIFGTPYPDDPTYPSDYNGPDIFNYFLVDANELLGEKPGVTKEFTISYRDLDVNGDGTINENVNHDVTYQLNTSGLIRMPKPAEWTRRRKAPGEIQLALSDLFQNIGRFQGSLQQYEELTRQIEDQAAQLQAQQNLNATEIDILNEGQNTQQSLNDAIATSRSRQLDLHTKGRMAVLVANALAEFLPKSIGLATDATSGIRGAIRLAGTVTSEVMSQNANRESLVELDHQQAQSLAQSQQNIRLTALRSNFAIEQQLLQLEQTIRRESQLRLEIFGAQEAMQQTMSRYMAAVAKGSRLLEDRLRFVHRTTGEINEARYKDMAFRLFRNDALQKYRAQYDLAATYVYLAAKAYDYETNLLGTDSSAGQRFLNQIVSARTIGEIGTDGQPRRGAGLSNAMATMNETWNVVKGRLRFDNPQQEDLRISLRSELFRIQAGEASQETWKETLRRHIVPNLNALPEYQKYAVPLLGARATEPAIVIPFSTSIELGHNFFGWPLASGDTSLGASTNFANKVHKVGVWFSNYNNAFQGLSTTPFVYLLPVGEDVVRSPTNGNVIRSWRIMDQIIPAPSSIDGVLDDQDYVPILSLSEAFGDIRRIGTFRAYHDGGFNIGQAVRDSRLVGRSVWNTRWLLIIPAASLLDDRTEALDRFIEGTDGAGVSDISLLFDTYGYAAQ